MLTITRNAKVSKASKSIASTPNEIRLSDAEIARRVVAIRSGWSIAERVRRRREADKRFLDLIDSLSACEAA
ncbi:hypothetical protein Pla52o_25910 [Novipirellula galeiformis]|uniref:Uncharacterized protein n=1 Tax=Novipirellula galeiformis TaxID=2528004 RepID=A0A5C6CH34_9BACT|nr:hypothetical protein [Novipirellula galeiformis]TWU23057.1 hypothetical protein Pla52o_25910 [Novipirellula galeiformis]